ncbi:hypothetical protein THAOC_07168 [Thalassiosira oceanica]|uniref:Lactate/malate dehydrogenase C-terminal domain-containing protein n=1 Tax=Thalassiosira oceanica TaxID=159749 RepID=K0T2K5_THAOC|nr:hypothetical protein THAOC_07168 [Thalassiosira oceanica]|eukprot:EJK71399.1 hypothetical protein THAOC_07168 [Thalassiosira oceanica]
MRGEGVVQCAFVESDLTDAEFFASPVRFGPNGVEEILPLGDLSPYEQQWFDKMMPELKKPNCKGKRFCQCLDGDTRARMASLSHLSVPVLSNRSGTIKGEVKGDIKVMPANVYYILSNSKKRSEDSD